MLLLFVDDVMCYVLFVVSLFAVVVSCAVCCMLLSVACYWCCLLFGVVCYLVVVDR